MEFPKFLKRFLRKYWLVNEVRKLIILHPCRTIFFIFSLYLQCK